MAKKVAGLLIVLLLGGCPSARKEAQPSSARCTQDTDCTPSHTCTYCGQCFMQQPKLETDCKMECLNLPSCACVNGACVGRPGGDR